MSLSEITEKLNDLGIQSDKFYLSKLQNGKITPGEEDFNRAFATVTNNDPEPLVFSSYIERTPDDVKQIIMQIGEFSNLLERAINNLVQIYNLEDLIDTNVQQDLLSKGITLENENFINHIKEKLTITEKWNLFAIISQQANVYSIGTPDRPEIVIDFPSIGNTKELDNSLVSLFRSELNLGIRDMWDIPIIKYLYSGGIFKDEDYIGVESINRYDLDNNFAFVLNVPDYGMSADGIEKNDQVLAILSSDTSPTEIYVVTIKDKPAIIRRVQFFEDYCVLRPSNPVMKLSIHNSEDIEILGKVIEVRQRRKI